MARIVKAVGTFPSHREIERCCKTYIDKICTVRFGLIREAHSSGDYAQFGSA